MRIGFIEMTTPKEIEKQRERLLEAGCEKIIQSDERSGSFVGLAWLMEYLRRDDTLVVTRLDRLSRDFKQLVMVKSDFEKRGIDLCVINHPDIKIGGKANSLSHVLFHVIALIAEFGSDETD